MHAIDHGAKVMGGQQGGKKSKCIQIATYIPTSQDSHQQSRRNTEYVDPILTSAHQQ